MTQGIAFVLPRTIHDEIIAHAREGTPEEVCGILSGCDGRATESDCIEGCLVLSSDPRVGHPVVMIKSQHRSKVMPWSG